MEGTYMAKNKYKVTKSNSIDYETEVLARYVEKNLKAGKVPCLRYCSAEELDKFEEYERSFRDLAKKIKAAQEAGNMDEVARLTAEVKKETAFMQKDLGVDGKKYQGAEQTNGNLIEGENYIFLFQLNTKDARALRSSIHIALESIKYERQVTEQQDNNCYPEYFSSLFFVDAEKFPTQYGRYWPNSEDSIIELKEYHINTKDFDPLSFKPASQVHDMKMLADFLVSTNRADYDIESLAEENKEFIDMARVLREQGVPIPYFEGEEAPKVLSLIDYQRKYKNIDPFEIESLCGLRDMTKECGKAALAELEKYYKNSSPKLYAAYKDIVCGVDISKKQDSDGGQGGNGGQGDNGGQGGNSGHGQGDEE